jgi:hypothetical protein
LNSSSSVGSSSDVLPPKPVEVSANEVVRLFGSTPQRVLVLQSLYRFIPRLHSEAEQANFDQRLLKGFQRGTYRQL